MLERLVEDEFITEAEATQIGNDFVLPDRARTTPGRINQRTYFTEALRDYLLNRSNLLGDTYDERYSALFRGGLRIHTTFDPNLQALAEQARNVLPDTAQGFDAAMVTLDTGTAAIRAMVGGRGFVPNERETNMALAPRQTGSSIKLFVLAAALQAGAQPNDIIDGANNCSFDVPERRAVRHQERHGAWPRHAWRAMTWSSINCAFVRLSQIVGLNRVVDMTYRMAQSPYLYPGQPEEDRDAIQPFISYSTGANEMSPLDMAAGGQTVANGGLHHEPYYVEYIDSADGRRIYTHSSAGTQVLDRAVALTAVDTLKGVLTEGTGRSYPLADGRPAAGKTGTQQDNTNAWFVGFTPYLTTAVWVGDPNGYTPMVNVPEFGGRNASRVQGGRYPTQIWKAFMDPAHANLPPTDWAAPPEPAREAARLYLPGNECLAQRVTTWRRRRRHRPGGRAGAAGRVRQPGPTAAATGGHRRHQDRRRRPRRLAGAGLAGDGAAGQPPGACRERDDRRPRQPRPQGAHAVGAARDRRRSVLTDDLLELQGTDTAIDQLTNRRGRLPEREAAGAAEAALAAADRRRAAIVARDEELERSIADLEAEGERLRAQRTRLEGQLRMVTSTRQAEALQHELDALAGRQDEFDDQELAHLDEQGALQAELADLDAARPALRRRLRTRQPSSEQQKAPSTPSWPTSPGSATAPPPASTRASSSATSDCATRFGGVAVARLDGARCTGCHLDLSTAELATARATPAGQFAACPHCGRLLVP